MWVAAGGRCAICNKLLLDEPYVEREINVSEQFGASGNQDTGPLRRKASGNLSQAAQADRLILLCDNDARIVDTPSTRPEYTDGTLLAIKERHEKRISLLTAIAEDRGTAVLRMFGSVRGSIPVMTGVEATQTVLDGSRRYACFPLSQNPDHVEIDLTHLPDPEKTGGEDSAYWGQRRIEIDRAMVRIREAEDYKRIRHVSVFAMARIPLLVYLGFVLDDKIPVDVYQKHRGEGEGWLWPEDGPAVAFEIVQRREGEPGGDVAFMLPLSGTFPPEDLPLGTEAYALFEIRPVDVTPNPNLFRSRATLDSFVRTYQDLLARLEKTHKSAKAIHLFPAVPITAAIGCGRHLMRDVHPALKIYDRVGNVFTPALTMNER
ncbi:MAG: SAVED domain-containing protein [Armatimonadota bacterium]